jgi:hypothetical protein
MARVHVQIPFAVESTRNHFEFQQDVVAPRFFKVDQFCVVCTITLIEFPFDHDANINLEFFLPPAQQPNPGQGRLLPEIYRSHWMTHRPSLDDESARPRDLYLTTHSTQKRQICMPLAGFHPLIPANPRLSPIGHWDRPLSSNTYWYSSFVFLLIGCTNIVLGVVHGYSYICYYCCCYYYYYYYYYWGLG